MQQEGYTDFMAKRFVVWFTDVDKHDIAIVGGKGANLGEMTKANLPVPPGFIITSESYYHFLDVNNLRPKIKKILTHLNVNDPKQLMTASESIKKLILHSPIPKEISKEIINYYTELPTFIEASNKKKNITVHIKKFFQSEFVAVRSSATAEDLPDASFAGQQETYLNVKGDSNLLEKVRKCWASLFESRAIFYRHEQKYDHFRVGIAVPVQKMINSESSGVMFTVDPLTGDKKKIVIEAIFGLGEFIVQGKETPDQYIVHKYTGEMVSKKISTQEKMMVRRKNGNAVLNIPHNLRKVQKIKNKQIYEIALLGKKIERHYFFPQDIEWALENNTIYITQTRPITTIGKVDKTADLQIEKGKQIYLTGTPASPGIVSGPVKILKSSREINKIKPGDILTAAQTNPDYVPAMRKAAAIITERGGRTSHAAIVSRELGIPAIVGINNVLSKLKNEEVITVDGSKGYIYKGSLISPKLKFPSLTVPLNTNSQREPVKSYKTATKVYINLAEPQLAQKYAQLPVDGVGLLRAEFMIADMGVHPKKLIHERRQNLFIENLSHGIGEICKFFSPRPVVYRTTDFKTNEYRNLKGGKAYEPEEPNPMLGYRGAYRYVADSRVFDLEIEAIKKVRNKMGYKNLWVMIPFVRTVDELIKVKKLMSANNLYRSSSFKLWMMVEIPSNVILLDDFIDAGIDGVSVGTNDLTMLILGTDRDNTDVASVFNERDPAVLWSLEKIIKTCHRRKITASICGQAASDYPDLVESLVEWGVTSVSVNPDAALSTKETIFNAEHHFIASKK